jgi:hypothetical protein
MFRVNRPFSCHGKMDGGGTKSDSKVARRVQGCQMVYLQTKNPDLGNFWRTFEWKVLVYFMTIWNIHANLV